MKVYSLRFSAALIGSVLTALSFSQATGGEIRPYRQLATGPAVVMNTSDFSPQIVVPGEYPAKPSSPNESPAPIKNGFPNNLKAGSVTSKAIAKLGPKFPAIGFTGWVPPDPDLAVGPNHVIATVNSDVAFFNKSTGAKTFQQTMDGNGFFNNVGVQSDFTFDPKCYFDKLSQRFFIVVLEADFGSAQISKILLAVSDDADPNGTWFKYRIEAKVTEGSDNFWLDYPGFGMTKDAVVFTGNMFPFAAGNGFASIIVLPKSPLLSGGSSTGQYLKDSNMFTVQVARTADATQTVMYGASAINTSSIRLVAISNLLGTPSLVTKDVTVPVWAKPSPVPAGGGRQLDGLDGRLFNLHFRGGSIVAAHNTKAPDGRMKARWYEFAVNNWPASGSPALRQSGDILLSGTNTHMPAINKNAAGDISVIYSRSNASTNPETCISTRFASDALGTIGAPQVLMTSSGTYGGAGVNRWGDYFGCEIDPVDNLTFWGIGMVAGPGGNWLTHINKWSVSSGQAALLVDPNAVSLVQGLSFGGDLTSLTGSDNNRYSVRSILIDNTGNETTNGTNAIGQVASFQVDFDLDLSAGEVSDLKAVVEANVSLTGPTGQIFAFDWGSGTFKSVGSFAMSTSDKTATISIPRTQLANYVDPTGNVRLLVRAFSPVRGGRPSRIPSQFMFNVDRVGLAPGFIAPP